MDQELDAYMEKVAIPIEDVVLAACIYMPVQTVKKLPVILFIHGWMGDQTGSQKYANALVGLGYPCVTFDLPGHGKSSGERMKLSRREFLQGVVAVYDFVESNVDIDDAGMYVVGESFGGYLSLLLTKQRNVQGLCLRVPSNYPNEGFDEPGLKTVGDVGVSEWREQSQGYTATFALQALYDFLGKVLIVESGNDEAVPHQTIQNYVQAVRDTQKLTYALMEDAPHRFKGDPKYVEEYIKILKDWFGNLSHLT